MFKSSFIDRYNISLNCHKLRSGKQQKWSYFFLEDCSLTINNSCFLHCPITWMLVPGEKYQYNNFSFQSWPPNESVTLASPLEWAPKIQKLIKGMSVSTLPHTQHLVSQMFNVPHSQPSNEQGNVPEPEARADPITQTFFALIQQTKFTTDLCQFLSNLGWFILLWTAYTYSGCFTWHTQAHLCASGNDLSIFINTGYNFIPPKINSQ